MLKIIKCMVLLLGSLSLTAQQYPSQTALIEGRSILTAQGITFYELDGGGGIVTEIDHIFFKAGTFEANNLRTAAVDIYFGTLCITISPCSRPAKRVCEAYNWACKETYLYVKSIRKPIKPSTFRQKVLQKTISYLRDVEGLSYVNIAKGGCAGDIPSITGIHVWNFEW